MRNSLLPKNFPRDISIIGFGRFGKLLASILAADFTIHCYDLQHTLTEASKAKLILIAVPIRNFATTIQSIATHLTKETIVIDVCSVKIYPSQVMQQYLPEYVDYYASHPLFGPDSYATKSTLKWMIYPCRNKQGHYANWKSFLIRKGFEMIEITPEEHDRQAARSQGITHFISRILQEYHFSYQPINTPSVNHLLEIMQLISHDTQELFYDLLNFNPYTSSMIKEFKEAVATIEQAIERNKVG